MKREYWFYAVVALATVINEAGLNYGLQCIMFPLAMLFVVIAGYKFLSRGTDAN